MYRIGQRYEESESFTSLVLNEGTVLFGCHERHACKSGILYTWTVYAQSNNARYNYLSLYIKVEV